MFISRVSPCLLVFAIGAWISNAARIKGHMQQSEEGDALDISHMEVDPQVEEIMGKLDKLVGLAKVKTRMRELVARAQFDKQRQELGLPSIGASSMHMRFLGNPGTGKTVVARIVGELLLSMGVIAPKPTELAAEDAIRQMYKEEDAKREGKEAPKPELVFREVSRADLVAGYTGQTAPKVKQVVASALGGVLFIDEAYSLVKDSHDTFGVEAVDTLIKEMEDRRDQLVVIFAGYEKEMESFFDANPGFKSRVPFSFHFDDYTCAELVDIGEAFLWKKQMNLGYLQEPTQMQGPLEFHCQDKSHGDNMMMEGCHWLGEATRFATGCCDDLEDPDCKSTRDNGNGRTVRNILEASYRQVSLRVLSEHDTEALEAFDATEKSSGDFHCGPGSGFQQLSSGNTSAVDADLRCAFALLKSNDLAEVMAPMLEEKYSPACGGTVSSAALLALPKSDLSKTLNLVASITGEEAPASVCNQLKTYLGAASSSSLLETTEELPTASDLLEVADESSTQDSLLETTEDSENPWKPVSPKPCELCRDIGQEIAKGKNPKWTDYKNKCYGAMDCLKAVVALRRAEADHQIDSHDWNKTWTSTCQWILCSDEAGDERVDVRCGCGKHDKSPYAVKRVEIDPKDVKKPTKPRTVMKPGTVKKPPTALPGKPVTKNPNKPVTKNPMKPTDVVKKPVKPNTAGNPLRPVKPLRPRLSGKGKPMLGSVINKQQLQESLNKQDKLRKGRADTIMEELKGMIGLDKVKAGMAELKAMVEFDSWRKKWFGKESSLLGQSFHMRFLGNPGTGKTVVARLVGRLLVELGVLQPAEEEAAPTAAPTAGRVPPTKGAKGKAPAKKSKKPIFEEVSRADLVAEYVGQTAPKVTKAVASAVGGVLFIDEAYSLVKGKKDTFGNEAVDTLIKEMEDKRDRVVVILAGYEDEMESFIAANPGFKSRVPFEFQFDDYTCTQLAQIGGFMLKGKGMQLDGENATHALEKAVKFSTGCCESGEECESSRENGNGRSVRNILEGSYRFMATRALEDTKVTKTLEKMGKVANDQLEDYCRREFGYVSGKCHNKEVIAKGVAAGKVTEPCVVAKEGSPEKLGCDALSHIAAPDIMYVLEEQIHQQLHKVCMPQEGKVESSPQAANLKRLARIVPYLSEREVVMIQSINTCEGAVYVLETAWSALPKDQSDKLSKEPAPVEEIKGATCEVQEVFDELKGLVGLQEVKKAAVELHTLVHFSKLRSNLLLPSVSGQSFHMRFLGNPGTGKTVVARLVGELLIEMGVIHSSGDRKSQRCKDTKRKDPNNLKAQDNANKGKADKKDEGINFQEVSRADLVAEFLGQTAPKVQAMIEKATGGVLFIDEAYSIVKGSSDSFGIEAVDTLIKEMEDKREKVIVILAGYEKEMDKFFSSNPGFKSRVPITFNFDDYLCDELISIGEYRYGKTEITLPPNGGRDNFGQLVRFASGCCDSRENCEVDRSNGNGRTVRNIVEASTRLMAARLSNSSAKPSVEDYKTLTDADMSAVAMEQAEETLGRGCAQRGFLSELTKALQNDVLSRYLNGEAPPTKRIKKLESKVEFAKKGFKGLLSKEMSKSMVGTCTALIDEFSEALKDRTDDTCGPKGALQAELPSALAHSDGLSPELATQISEAVGAADDLIKLLKNLEDTDKHCANCLKACTEARNTIESIPISMKAGSLINFVTS